MSTFDLAGCAGAVRISRRALAVGAAMAAVAPAGRLVVAEEAAPDGAGWALVRRYRLTAEADRAALVAMTEEAYGPLLREQAGFVSYYVLRPADDAWTSVTVWRDEAAAEAGVAALRPWIEANVLPSIDGEPEGFAGAVELAAFAEDAGENPAGDWVTIRSWPLAEDADRAAMLADTEAGYLPLLRSLEGFVAFFVVRPDDRTWTGIAAWRDAEAAAAALDPIREWVAENVGDALAGEPEGVEGAVDLAVFAERPAATPTP